MYYNWISEAEESLTKMSYLLLNWKKTRMWILLIIFIVPTFYRLLGSGYFQMQDVQQAFRIQQMDKCFQDGQIPCRWVPDMGFYYGYPQFNYYPPSVYYAGELLHLLGLQFIDAIKIMFILGFIVSGFTMYLFLRSVVSSWASFVGTVLYVYAPYKAVDTYVRGDLSEFWSLAFFPLIFWSSSQLIRSGKLKYLLWLAISIGLLLLTHNLMTLIFFPVVLIWVVILLIMEKNWRRGISLLLGGTLGVGLAAFFTLPVALERSYAHIESMIGGYFDYRQHFVDINQLFFSNHFGYGSSVLGPGDDFSFSVGIIQWIIALLGVLLAAIGFKKHKKVSIIVLILAALELGVLFMIHQKSSFIWTELPFLVWLQFPWRFLAVSTFLLPFFGAYAIYFVQNHKLSKIIGGLAILVAITLYINFFQPKSWINITDQELFSGESMRKQVTASIFDYLPIYATLPPISKAPDLPEILIGQANFANYYKGSDFQVGEVTALQKSIIRLPLFDFPGMKVTIDGKEVEHSHNDCRNEQFCLGLITFDIPAGSHIIKAQLTNTWPRAVGNILTIVSLIIIFILLILGLKRKSLYEYDTSEILRKVNNE